MASATSLLPGFQYKITDGDFAGESVTIIRATSPFPDCDFPVEHKKGVAHDCNPHPRPARSRCWTRQGVEHHFLPRQILPEPVGMEGVNVAPAQAAFILDDRRSGDRCSPRSPARRARRSSAWSARSTRSPTPMDKRLDHLRPYVASATPLHGQYVGATSAPASPTPTSCWRSRRTPTVSDSNNAGRPASLLIKGDTQSGKTMLVEVLACLWADKLGLPKPMPIFTISGSSGVTDYDLFGQTTSYTDPTTGAESLVWLPGMVELASAVGGILYLDEVNALDPRVTSSLHPLIDHRHMFVNRNKAVWRGGQFMAEVTAASLDLWVIGTLNEAYAGMGKLNEAFINRFEHVVWGYHGDVEVKLIDSAAIRLLGDALRTARERNSIRTPCGTAALQRCVRNVRVHGPVVGLNMLAAMFLPNERPIVESIIEDRSIIILLNEELRQAAAEAAHRA